MNPPLRAEADRQALIEGLRDGAIDCIATDHAPHTVDDKRVEYDHAAFGIVGLETAVALCLDRLVGAGPHQPRPARGAALDAAGRPSSACPAAPWRRARPRT